MVAETSAMKLYFSRNYNPRLAVAVARYLNSPVEFEFASPFSPEQGEKLLKLNPTPLPHESSEFKMKATAQAPTP